MSDVILDTKFICELPQSRHPWSLECFNGQVIAVNLDHPPRIIHSDGTYTEFEPVVFQ